MLIDFDPGEDRHGPWLGKAMAALASRPRKAWASPALLEYRHLPRMLARMHVLDEVAALEANEVAYGDFRGVEALCDIVHDDLLPCWIEYDPKDRSSWYQRPENLGSERNADNVPERTGIIAIRDTRGRTRIDHCFLSDGKIRFAWVTGYVNGPQRRIPDGEGRIGLIQDPERPVERGQLVGRSRMMSRLSFAPTRSGERLASLIAAKPGMGKSAAETFAMETTRDAEAETTYALGALCMLEKTRRRPN